VRLHAAIVDPGCRATVCNAWRVRICLVYDCHYPHTIGGAERWYAALARHLVASGHDVTYLTLRQWDRGAPPAVPYRLLAVGPRMRLYTPGGRRRILPPLVFGAGVLAHLARHGSRYEVVHTASFPFFSVLAAGALRRLRGYALVVDWFEVWSRAYWRGYLGAVGGAAGSLAQAACARVPQRAFSFSELHAARLREIGSGAEIVVLRGLHPEVPAPAAPSPASRRVVFAGRHIPEKRVPAIVHAIAIARREMPGLTGTLFGDGPERQAVQAAIAEHGLGDAVAAPGFVPAETVAAALGDALCLVLPSAREGYGLAVLEAMARGTPVVLVAGEDNAAVEHMVEGVNGVVAPSAAPVDLAAAILAVEAGGQALRESTARWYEATRESLSIERSFEQVTAAYRA
jgi:glycosyltransferase involved in cell wall biosynthesis